MKVITKKMLVVVTRICLVGLSFAFLFREFGPGEEKVTIWLPSNYQLTNDTNSSGEIIPKTNEEDYHLVMLVSMQDFKNFFEKSKDKIEISIISDNSSLSYNINYRIHCQTTDKNSFIIKSTDSHDCTRRHFLKSVKIDQKTGVLLLECKRDWPTISFLFALILIVICGFSAILWVRISEKKLTQDN